jgi:hypothetical protein
LGFPEKMPFAKFTPEGIVPSTVQVTGVVEVAFKAISQVSPTFIYMMSPVLIVGGYCTSNETVVGEVVFVGVVVFVGNTPPVVVTVVDAVEPAGVVGAVVAAVVAAVVPFAPPLQVPQEAGVWVENQLVIPAKCLRTSKTTLIAGSCPFKSAAL